MYRQQQCLIFKWQQQVSYNSKDLFFNLLTRTSHKQKFGIKNVKENQLRKILHLGVKPALRNANVITELGLATSSGLPIEVSGSSATARVA